MKVYIYTRFALPFYSRYTSSRTDIDEYQKWLYDDKRLEQEIDILFYFTKYTIENQTYSNYEWLFFVGHDTPNKFIDKLKTIKQASIILSSNTLPRQPCFIPKDKKYIAVRLDDDDGLHIKYFELLQNYEVNGTVIAPIYGNNIFIHPDRTIEAQEINIYDLTNPNRKLSKLGNKKIRSAGLSCISMNPFKLGNHTRVHLNYPIAYLEDKNMFFQSIGPNTATKRKFFYQYPTTIYKNIETFHPLIH
jgi:hypothetical protein